MSRFEDCLLGASVPVIMEIKRRGGDGADLLRGRSVRDVVERYEALGAPCLSVVTGSWFGGDEALLREVASLTDLPILRKDMIRGENELGEAKAMGASAVLLIARVLSRSALRRLTLAALEHDLTPVVEIATPSDLQRVAEPTRCVISVNNKDVLARERGAGDLRRSLALLPALRCAQAHATVSASAIERSADARRLLKAGFDALLIGTGLLLADDLGQWLADACALSGVGEDSTGI